ncbi:MAG: AraC family transcriptional regulator [Burkholderiaceae bacterium]|nr:AraC family transcriptional regulator [Burkholderiaceae bacterium]
MTTGRVRVAPLMALLPLLRERAIDAAGVLAAFGYDVAFFDEPDNTLPFDVAARLLEHCAEVTRCDHFGLLVGQRGGLSVLGPVGFLMQSSPDVRSALVALGRYLHIHDRGAVIGLAERGGFAALSYTVMQAAGSGRGQVLDTALAIGFNLMRALCGSGWLPSEVQIAHRAPADRAPFRRFFGATVRFDADQSALLFPSHWLDRPIASADPLLHRMMEQRIRQLQTLGAEQLVDQLRRLLVAWVTEPSLSLERVAAQIGMNPRTLNRRLAVEGASFAQLRDEARREAACGLLRDTDTPAAEIANLLCYADAAAFSRAFKRWTGTAPAAWRTAARGTKRAARARRQ